MIADGSAPDHTSISSFRKRHLKDLAGLSSQVLPLCREAGVFDNPNVDHRGCGRFPGPAYAVRPRLFRYSSGLNPPSDILIRVSLYQRM